MNQALSCSCSECMKKNNINQPIVNSIAQMLDASRITQGRPAPVLASFSRCIRRQMLLREGLGVCILSMFLLVGVIFK